MTSAAQVPEDDPAVRSDDDERLAPSGDEPVDPYAEQALREQLLGPEDDPD